MIRKNIFHGSTSPFHFSFFLDNNVTSTLMFTEFYLRQGAFTEGLVLNYDKLVALINKQYIYIYIPCSFNYIMRNNH
jgi:hypothetical protein